MGDMALRRECEGEMGRDWGEMGRFGEIGGDMALRRECEGDMGRFGERLGDLALRREGEGRANHPVQLAGGVALAHLRRATRGAVRRRRGSAAGRGRRISRTREECSASKWSMCRSASLTTNAAPVIFHNPMK